ncbi:MAG: DEAD/DEAH box helicase [Bacteroidetes bacterium]|nr:DEAD/DEAH box helicase [Bacteroidota bacterium]
MDTAYKPILLLSPWQITEGLTPISLLSITKNKGVPDYTAEPLQWTHVRKIFRDFPKPCKDHLMNCCAETVEEIVQRVKQVKHLQKGEASYDSFLLKNITQHWQKTIESLKPYFPLIKWYHRKKQEGKKNFITAPCVFSRFRPELYFEVSKSNGLLVLETLISIHGKLFPLKTFQRNQFLLESRNEYFILNYRDYRTLEKISAIDFDKFSHNPELFSSEILTELETNYKVERHNFFPKTTISVTPVNRLLLSELNNAFLMLTPQWVYDGNITDGEWKSNFKVIKNGNTQIIERNKEAESAFISTLVSLHPNFSSQRNGYYYLSFADAQKKQWFLKVYHQLLQMNIEIAGIDMLKHFRYSPHEAVTQMKLLKENENHLTYEMEIYFGKEKVPLPELQKMLLAGQKAVLLKDGALGVLGESWIYQYGAIIKHGKVSSNEIELLRWIAVTTDKGNEENIPLRQAVQKNWWQQWEQWQQTDKNIYNAPAALNAELRPYQHKGYEWILMLNEIGAGACLADDMGLGKTLQSIAAIIVYISKKPGTKNIIICPSSLIYNWQQEFERFAPFIQVLVYHGQNRKKEDLTITGNQVIITTYSTMRNDADYICGQAYGIAVVDESHNIKNPIAQITQAVMKLRAGFRLALSGTPVVNNTFDLYSQLNFVVPGLFGSREFFKREYADPIDTKQDEEKVAALKRMTAPFILRRTKEQVAKDLPDKTESVLWCEMNGLQRSIYEEILKQTRNSIFLEVEKNGLSKSKFSILQGMTKLRQVCSSPVLLPKDDQQTICTESVKMQMLMDELTNILPVHKVLVFSQFSSMLQVLAEECKKNDFKFYHFDGQTPPAKRTEMVNAFQQPGNNVPLFLISLKAGNTGLTLTAADYVFLFDPWWNTAVEDQAIDRTHRIGQTKNVFAYKMICKNSIEEKIINLQQKKKKLSEDLISAEEGFVKSLTEEDLEYLFS